jgi:hypothetical protein
MFRGRCCLLLTVLCGLACSKSTTPGQGSDTSAPCYRACLIMVAADCVSYRLASADQCASSCYAEHSAFQQCRAESDAFYACVADAGALSCMTLQTEAGALSVPDTSACNQALCARDRCYVLAQDGSTEPSICATGEGGAIGEIGDGALDGAVDGHEGQLEASSEGSMQSVGDAFSDRSSTAFGDRGNPADAGCE